MRLNILILALLSPAAAAQAGSIDAIKTGTDAVRSIETIKCDACVRKTEKKAEAAVELAPGTQKIEIREVDGVRKIYRTEAWLGGSPVVFVSKAPPEQAPALADDQPVEADGLRQTSDAVSDQPPAAAEADMIDEKAKTSAVNADTGATAKVEPRAAAFDPAKLELRLN